MRTARPAIRVRGLLWLLGIGCLAVPLLLLSARSGSGGYRRFISRPLPDGSRYTFLYPAYLKYIQENGPSGSTGVTQNVSIYNRQVRNSPWDGLRRWMGLPDAEPMESVTVLVLPQKQGAGDSRHGREWERGLERRHDEYLHAQLRELQSGTRRGAVPAGSERYGPLRSGRARVVL